MHLEDGLGEDDYKNRLCILSSLQGIILDVLKVCIDDFVFSAKINEALSWTPSFSSNIPKSGSKNIDVHGHFEEEGSFHSMHDKEDISCDPFGIYETMEKN